jgi:hypothetical protein
MPTVSAQEFLDELDALLATKEQRGEWPGLVHDAIAPASGHDAVRVELVHGTEPQRSVAIEVRDREVIVTYHPEHLTFTLREEALRFIEMLGDGRVTLVVKRRLFWNAIWSYRDNLALPFNKTLEPWLNIRPRVETLQFGFIG